MTRIGSTVLDLYGADATTADEVQTSVENFYRDFPVVASRLAAVSINWQNVDGSLSFIQNPHAYAATSPRDDVCYITLNPAYYRNREKLIADTLYDYEKGYHGFSQPCGSMEHELGHVLDWMLSEVTGELPSNELEYADAFGISGYARQSQYEAFAEAFANYRMGVPVGPTRVTDVLSRALRSAGCVPCLA